MNAKVSQILIIVAIVFVGVEAAFCIDSPVGSPTVPPSATQSGLIPNPRNQSINGGNDIVTGNVGGGREFRGIVPYGSTAYIQAPLGTSNLDSFIRNSTGVPYATDRSPGTVQPYYSPFQSVSSLSSRTPNSYSSSSSSALKIPQMAPLRQPSTFGLVPLEEAQKLQQPNASLFEPQNVEKPDETPQADVYRQYGAYRPLSSTPLEMEKYISEQISGKLNLAEQQQALLEKAPLPVETKEGVLGVTVKPSEPFEPGKTYEPVQPGKLPEQIRPEIAKKPGVFEQMEKKVHDEFEKNVKEMAEAKKAPAEANEAAEANKPGMTKAIIGYSTTFAARETDRFNGLMKAGEEYLKQKQYYKAADAYTLAAVYQPQNPLPYAGKAHALLGAHEYMSSAYFLNRAIDIFPDYTRFKVDLVSMFGDKDELEKCVTNISQWQERTNSPELLFLLAYIYLETDRLELAQRMINGALAQMPQSRALLTLDKVIRRAIEDAGKTGTP